MLASSTCGLFGADRCMMAQRQQASKPRVSGDQYWNKCSRGFILLGFWVDDLMHEQDFISKPTDLNSTMIWFGFGGGFPWGIFFSNTASFLNSRSKMMPAVGPCWDGTRVGLAKAKWPQGHDGRPGAQNGAKWWWAARAKWRWEWLGRLHGMGGEVSSGAGQRKRKEEKGWAGWRELDQEAAGNGIPFSKPL
jgi:hypothetical protein